MPHIYLTVDVRLDALLKLRAELNASLESRGIKLSVNDMLIKALGLALVQVPKCNVSFAGDTLIEYQRADISVAVSVPNGLITPIITGADSRNSRSGAVARASCSWKVIIHLVGAWVAASKSGAIRAPVSSCMRSSAPHAPCSTPASSSTCIWRDPIR